MAFDWLHFLKLAQQIKDEPQHYIDIPEAAYRTAVSRAYYAAFKHAFGYGIKKGYVPTHDGRDHAKIQEYLKTLSKDPKDPVRKASVDLERLLDLRTIADYENELNREPTHIATNAISLANSILGKLQNELPASVT